MNSMSDHQSPHDRTKLPAGRPRDHSCSAPALHALLPDYCFGDLDEQPRTAVEAHILECDVCWDEVRTLEASLHALRSKRQLAETLLTPGVIGLFGYSGRLQRPLGGHLVQACIAALLYGLIYALSVLFEVAYEFQRYGTGALIFAGLFMLPWIVGTCLFAFAADVRVTRHGRPSGLMAAVIVTVASAGLAAVAAWFFLPATPITLSTVPAYPAQAAFVKDIVYYVPLGVVFVVIPFHFVIVLQHQLQHRRHREVFGILISRASNPLPRGTFYIKVWQLTTILGCAGFASLYLTTHLTEHLRFSGNMALFLTLIHVRTAFYFALALECVVWYGRLLEEIKRECVAVLGLMNSHAGPGS